jgi:membrane protease YdiL (CAAX protease family)
MQQFELAIAAVLTVGSLSVWLVVLRRLLEWQPVVPREPRLCVPWIGIDVFLLIIAWPVLEIIAVRMAGAQAALLAGETTLGLVAAVTAAHVVWAGLALVYLARRTAASAGDLGFDATGLRHDARLGFFGFLAAVFPVYAIEILVSQFVTPHDHPLVKLVHEHLSAGLLAGAALSAVVVAPLAEELLFRVLLHGWLERQMDLLAARPGYRFTSLARVVPILASSTAFALMHQGPDRLALFVLALFLGYLYQQTHRIFPSLILHACINALAVVGLSLGVR